jgi:hypothetical protein
MEGWLGNAAPVEGIDPIWAGHKRKNGVQQGKKKLAQGRKAWRREKKWDGICFCIVRGEEIDPILGASK